MVQALRWQRPLDGNVARLPSKGLTLRWQQLPLTSKGQVRPVEGNRNLLSMAFRLANWILRNIDFAKLRNMDFAKLRDMDFAKLQNMDFAK